MKPCCILSKITIHIYIHRNKNVKDEDRHRRGFAQERSDAPHTFFCGEIRELYLTKRIRWTVSQQAADQEARSLIHPALGHIQSARKLCTEMSRDVGCPYYMLNLKRSKSSS
jgi:hypothetical protein